MRKPFVWALMAILAVAGSAFAGQGIVANATFPVGAPATTNNDDSCDISVAPAATLLLPYFEVDLANAAGETTLFTVANVSQVPQIAHVTVWTDRSFPVLDFNIFLTGYDVQSINMYDIIVRGRIAEPGTTSDEDDNPPGQRSLDNDDNPVFVNLLTCENLAVTIPPGLLADLRSALTTGNYGGCDEIGDDHANAIGYVTVDVSRSCSTFLPYDPTYYTDSTGIAFDNTLIGDYQQVNSENNFAQGNPMVHIRAIPEGGVSGALATNFDRTFYSRYQDGATLDRRQPLPSTFAARWIEGGVGSFQTDYKIWREGVTGDVTENDACGTPGAGYHINGDLVVSELVRFDEQENPFTFLPDVIISPAPEGEVSLPETSRTSISDTTIYPDADGAIAGWLYLNLHNGAPEDAPALVASQNWVTVSMRAEGRYSVDFDAASLGNGCSPIAASTDPDGDAPAIGPAGGICWDGVTFFPCNVTPDFVP